MKRIVLVAMLLMGAAKGWAQCDVYPTGVGSITISTIGDTTVTFHWTGDSTGLGYRIIVTTDSTNSHESDFVNNFRYTYIDFTQTDSIATVSPLAANVHWYIFIQNQFCNSFDSTSFWTSPWNCGSYTLQPGVIPVADSCSTGAQFGMNQTNALQRYTFEQNGKPITGYTGLPGSNNGNTVSYPLPNTQSAAGIYRVVTYFPSCPGDSIVGDSQAWYPSGLYDLTIDSFTTSRLKFHWKTVFTGYTYQWAITDDSTQEPPPANTTKDSTVSLSMTFVPGTKYYLYVWNSAGLCKSQPDSMILRLPGCAALPPKIVIADNNACTFDQYQITNPDPAQSYIWYQGGYPLGSAFAGNLDSTVYFHSVVPLLAGQNGVPPMEIFVTTSSACGGTATSNILWSLPAGTGGLSAGAIGSTSATLHWAANVPGETYAYTITTDSTNQNPAAVAAKGVVHDTTLVASGLAPATRYFALVTDSSCGGAPDTTAFTTAPAGGACGLVALDTLSVGDSTVKFHWTSVAPGQTYRYTITTDPANSKPALVVAQTLVSDTVATVGQLKPQTTYYIFVADTACLGGVSSISFKTDSVDPCSQQPLPSLLDNEIPCMDNASFGMDVTYANQSYTFYFNGKPITGFQGLPGSSSGGISYQVPAEQQQYAGTYTVQTYITACPTNTITLNPTVAYFGGVQNLTVTHYTDTSLTFSWQTAQTGSQYRWAVSTSPNGPAANSYDTTLNTSATATGLLPGTIYYIYVTNLSTCPSEADTLSFVTAIGPVNNCPPGSGPVASFTSNTQRFTVCGNGALLLESGSATGNVWWLNGQPLDSTGATLAVTQSGNYSLVVTDASGCSDTSIVQPVVLDPGPPIPTLSWTGSTMICPGSGLAITSSADDGNQWYNGNAAIPDEVNTTYVAKDAGVYWVQVTDANGCFASSTTVPVTMSSDTSGSTVVPEILPAGPLLLCSDTTILLVASSAVNYQWFINGAALPGDTASTLQVNLSGNYSVATGTAGCGSIGTVSNVVAITYVGQLVPVITLTNGVLVSNYADGNQWYLNDSLIRGATKQQFTPPGPGSYTLRVEVGVQTIDTSTFQIGVGGCYSEFSLPYKITDSNFVAPQVVFYPNPMVDVLNIMNKGSGPVTIRVFNMMGAQLMERVNVQGTLQVDVRGWGKGAYIVVVTDQSTQAQQKATLIRL
jgi:hypothetical protein